MDAPDNDERIGREEAAHRLGVSPSTVDRYALAGYLTRERNPITRRTTYSAREVEQLRRSRAGTSGK